MEFFIGHAGALGWLIATAAVAALALFFERLFHLHRAEIKTEDFLSGIKTIVQRDNLPEAVKMCDQTPGPVAYVTRTALLHHNSERDALVRAVEDAGLEEVPRLERRLRTLMTLAQISPLLGLLGTVVGLAQSLMIMEQNAPLVHMGDVTGGIWRALLTTAAGLLVAIPAYAGHNLLLSRIERLVMDMEQAAAEMIRFLEERKKNRGDGQGER
ncbi:MotA/TolQ/ExbB proton channel family protein [Kiritimatiella glycovorans]|uniref:Biopolymer transport protein ExbB n=1 Tax=Kiritimatiella glycovorans TaxID=1307763 RepID=A0A0G3EJF1_9BACT|nr:MotA/TolQ/ExbB proton channel family protein [Kiritimatiella glycovorans]AKJ65567.1 Biopolymer transport protein ExbB [Kiritimatiella glycovorans]